MDSSQVRTRALFAANRPVQSRRLGILLNRLICHTFSFENMNQGEGSASAAPQVDNNNASDAAAAGGATGGADNEAKPSGEHLSLKVKSQDGNEVYFKVKRTTAFSKVMNAYCKKVGADPEQVRFLFDGQRLRADQTPADLDMEDEDEIDAMVSQTGGSSQAQYQL